MAGLHARLLLRVAGADGQLMLGSAADDLASAPAARATSEGPLQPAPQAVVAVQSPSKRAASGNGGRSAAVTVRGPGGAAVAPTAVQLVSDVAERRLQRLLEKLRAEGFALGMRLTPWFQARRLSGFARPAVHACVHALAIMTR